MNAHAPVDGEIAEREVEDVVVPARPRMPPEIAAAVVAVMAKITPLSKDATNSFQRYDYVSVDQFYALVGRLMAEAGIFTVLYEKSMVVGERKTSDDRGNVKTSVWLSAVYDVWLYHKTGAAFGPVERSITVPASGAQSYASAISFVEKYYLRSLFKIPTGDGDTDQDDKRNLPATNGRRDTPARYEGQTAGQGAGMPEDEATQSKVFYIRTAERDWSEIET